MNPNKAKANNRNLPSGDPYVYVTYELDNLIGYVAVIDPVEDRIIKRIKVGFNPGPMCMDPAEKKLYVVNTLSNSVTIIDADTSRILKTVRVGTLGSSNTNPVAIFAAPNGNKVYVANSGDQNVTIIDALTDTVIKNVDIFPGGPVTLGDQGKPFAFAGHEASSFVYVACKVADKKDYVVAISLEDDHPFPYNRDIQLTFDMSHNPLTVHPDGDTQVTLGPIGMATYFGDGEIGLPNTSSVLDNTVSGVYLDNKLLFCTTLEEKAILKRITNLTVDWKGNITFDKFADVPSYKGQDKIRVSRTQGYIGVTIQPTTFPEGGLQIYNVNGGTSQFVSLASVGDLAFFSDTKAYVGELTSVRPIDLATATALPAIPLGHSNNNNVTVKNIISGYSNQSQ
ncbi:YncE family protein [Paenibacillus sp. FSL H8-0122]|uniref:YncE family protein n=1 Tax=Paenibacillus sp. FSL H8-0122 TaxID=2954510 RepID=UPI0030F705D6